MSHHDQDGQSSNADRHPGSVMARLSRPTTDRRTRVAVVGDPHLSTRAAGTSKLFERSEQHLRNAVEDATTRDIDALLSVGDLTKDGEPWNYRAVDEILADVEVPFLAVPGNHDVPKDGDDHETPSVGWFAERYATGSFPFVERVGGLDVVGLNSSGTADRLADTHDGAVDEPQRAFLADVLPDLDAPLVLVHHNLPGMARQVRTHRAAVRPEMHEPPVMREVEPLLDVLRGERPPLLVTGHLHMPSMASTEGVREVVVPTTCSFPQGYLLVESGPEGTTVRFVPVADRAGLRRAHHERATDSTTSGGLTAMAAVRVASFPLVDDRRSTD